MLMAMVLTIMRNKCDSLINQISICYNLYKYIRLMEVKIENNRYIKKHSRKLFLSTYRDCYSSYIFNDRMVFHGLSYQLCY